MGWPSATAPPFGFTFRDRSRGRCETAQAWAAKASLDSITSISSMVRPAFFERVCGGGDRAQAHDARLDAGMAVGDQAGERLGAAAGDFRAAGEHQGGGAVVEAGGVAGGDRAILLEGGFQRGQALGDGIGAGMFIGVENHRALAGRAARQG